MHRCEHACESTHLIPIIYVYIDKTVYRKYAILVQNIAISEMKIKIIPLILQFSLFIWITSFGLAILLAIIIYMLFDQKINDF